MAARPLLKWAGGKRQLLPALRRFYPPDFGRYIEPFVGSGAVFFDLYNAGRLRGKETVLVDSNADLIGCYEAVRDAPDDVVRALDDLAAGHAADARGHYYRVRDERFNPLRDHRRGPDGRLAYSAELAAMFIYLNRTGFNGLFRVNSKGTFNVPAGKYDRPHIADRERLAQVAEALSAARLRLVCGSFESALDVAAPGDFVYFDPPYAPLSRTARFTSYTAPCFTAQDQRRLQQIVITLAARGCHVLLSNSTADEVAALYERSADACAAGLRTIRVPARRAINSNPAARGAVAEFLISNIRPAA